MGIILLNPKPMNKPIEKRLKQMNAKYEMSFLEYYDIFVITKDSSYAIIRYKPKILNKVEFPVIDEKIKFIISLEGRFTKNELMKYYVMFLPKAIVLPFSNLNDLVKFVVELSGKDDVENYDDVLSKIRLKENVNWDLKQRRIYLLSVFGDDVARVFVETYGSLQNFFKLFPTKETALFEISTLKPKDRELGIKRAMKIIEVLYD